MKLFLACLIVFAFCGLESCNMAKFYAGKRIGGGENIKQEKTVEEKLPVTTPADLSKEEKNSTGLVIEEEIASPVQPIQKLTDEVPETEIPINKTQTRIEPDSTRTDTTLVKPKQKKKSKDYLVEFGGVIVISLVIGLEIGILAFLISWIFHPAFIAFPMALPWAIGGAIVVFVVFMFLWLVYGWGDSHPPGAFL